MSSFHDELKKPSGPVRLGWNNHCRFQPHQPADGVFSQIVLKYSAPLSLISVLFLTATAQWHSEPSFIGSVQTSFIWDVAVELIVSSVTLSMKSASIMHYSTSWAYITHFNTYCYGYGWGNPILLLTKIIQHNRCNIMHYKYAHNVLQMDA